MNLIVGISSILLTYKILMFSNFIDSLLSLFILYIAQIVITQLLSGILNILYIHNVILLNLLILIIIWFFSRDKKFPFNFVSLREALIEIFSNKVILFCASLIIGFGLVKIFINLVNPPFGWDCLNYHFSFPVEWLKHGNLNNPITISDDPSPPYYPINGSLLFLWLILPLKNVFLADLGQVPFFILAFLAAYNISRKIGLNREMSFYAAGLFLITPNFFKQIEIAYVDVMVAALFLTGVNFLLALYKDFSLNNLILCPISLGLFLGTKTLAVVYVIAPILFFVWIIFKNINKVGFKKIVLYFVLFILLISVFGGFTYIRNYIQTGNPLYPADIEVLGKRIFKGVMPFSTYRSRWGKQDFNLEKLLFHEGMGGQFIIFIVPSLLLSLPLTFIKRKKNINFSLIFILFLPIILLLSFWFLMPQLWVRYLYPFLAVSFVVAMYTIDLLNIPTLLLRIIIFICFVASAVELSGYMELISSIILSLLFFIFLPRILRFKFNLRFISIIPLLLIGILTYLNINYNKYEFRRYLSESPFPKEEAETWFWLNNNTHALRIAYVGRPDVLPLYGTHFKNDIIYISVNNVHPVKLHYFPNARYVWTNDFITLHKSLENPNNYRGNANYSIWLKNLKSENIDYLLLYSLHQVRSTVFPIEDAWSKAHPEVFNLVFDNKKVHIYKIIK